VIPYTDQDRLCLNRYRGLPEKIMLELNDLDEHAIGRDCRFSEKRRQQIPDRLRALELRRAHGLGPLDKLKRIEE
jgi:hypothetical protein